MHQENRHRHQKYGRVTIALSLDLVSHKPQRTVTLLPLATCIYTKQRLSPLGPRTQTSAPRRKGEESLGDEATCTAVATTPTPRAQGALLRGC